MLSQKLTGSNSISVILTTFMLVILTFSFTANAASQIKKQQKYQCQVISKSKAISNAKRRIKGKVVAANLIKKGDRSVYKVRVLVDKKRVKTITIPACQ